MAVTRGCLGKIYVKDAAVTSGATQMLRVRDWSFSESAERLESSEIGSCTKTYVAGAVETSGTINVFWDATTGANQSAMTVANDVYMEFYIAGYATGTAYYKTPTGGANIQEVSRSGGVDGIVQSTYSFTVNGSLTATSL
jgi:hypothetical protein